MNRLFFQNKKLIVSYFILALFFLFISAPVYPDDDIIYTNDGEEYRCTLIGIDTEYVYFKIKDKNNVLKTDSINKIKISSIESLAEKITVDDLEDTVIKNIYNSNRIPQKHNGADYVILYSNTVYKLDKKMQLTEIHRKIMQVLTEQGKDIASNSITYNKDYSKSDIIWARTIQRDATVNIISRTGLEKSDVYSSYPEYNRIKEIKYVLPKVQTGSILDIKYRIVKNKISVYNNTLISEYFSDYYPILKKEVTVIFPENVKFNYSLLNDTSFIKTNIRKKDGFIYYKFTVFNVPPLIHEVYLPPGKDYIACLTGSLKFSWDDICVYMKNAIKPLTPMSAKLFPEADNSIGSIKKIYRYIAKDIRLISVPISLNDYKPVSEQTILKNSYGSQLDKAYLLYLILNYYDYDVSLLLCAANNTGKFHSNIPSASLFNAAIVKIRYNNTNYYLNPLNENIPFGYISDNYQLCTALNIGLKKFEVIDNHPPSSEKSVININAAIDTNGKLSGNIKLFQSGSGGINLKYYKYMVKEQIDKTIESLANRIMSSQTIVKDYTIKNLEINDTYPVITIDFTCPKYASKAGSKLLLFKLPGISHDASPVSEKTRFSNLYWGEESEAYININLELPEKFNIFYKPKSIQINEKHNNYKNNFSLKDNILSFNEMERYIGTGAERDYYYNLKPYLEKLSIFSQDWIVLKRNSVSQ